VGIAVVERDTGISKDSLRVWERRYGFPQPERDAHGERLYSRAQVRKLMLVKRLLDRGYRPGRLVPASEDELDALLGSALRAAAPQTARDEALEPFIDALRAHRFDELRRLLSQALLRMGLAAAVQDLVAPLTRQVGELWLQGVLQVFEEHVYCETVQSSLRVALQTLPRSGDAAGPRVLLATLPGEHHGLGLLMAETMLSLEGCLCLSLGVRTPVDEIAAAARAHSSDIVALSCSSYLPAAPLLTALSELRATLAPPTELWVGGGNALLTRRRLPPGVHAVTELARIASEVQRWRWTPASR
jgi:methanogenic corrinoid protein MtbC1